MDRELATAAHALAGFDPLAALKRIALREDPDALALRGIAMAQLGEHVAARKLLARAASRFETTDRRAWARCLAAQGEVALAMRDLTLAKRLLDEAARALDAAADEPNALFVRLQRVRCLVLVGAVDEAREAHRALDLRHAPPRLRALAALVAADIAMRALAPADARASLEEARGAAAVAGLPWLAAEVRRAEGELAAPVARQVRDGAESMVTLADVDRLFRGGDLVVDGCRRSVRGGATVVSLVSRPVLLALATALARAAPGEARREALAAEVFGVRRVGESTRVRVRVEVGRLRRALASVAVIEATGGGYALRPVRGGPVVLLLPPAAGESSAVLALLRGGESWPTSALALAIGGSQRAVQRALATLREEGHVAAVGRGRAQRWVARPPEGFATSLLLVTHAPRR